MPLKKRYRPAGNSIGLKRIPVSTNLFHPSRYQLFQSGTAALSAAITACVKLKGKHISKPEIIVPAYACPDLISAALFAGVTPIPCDLAENSPDLSVEYIRGRITADTVAIISINFLGLPGNLAELKSFCANQKLFLIYDCARWLKPDGFDYSRMLDVSILPKGDRQRTAIPNLLGFITPVRKTKGDNGK